MSSVNRRLKELRASASPPISQSVMAEELGFDSRQAYHFYESENGFKQAFLPPQLARRIAAILAERGVDSDAVLALAGIGIDEMSTPSLSASEERWLKAFRRLSANQRRLMQQLLDELADGDRAQPMLHAPDDFRPAQAGG